MIVVGFLAIFTLLAFYAGAWVRKHSSWTILWHSHLPLPAFIVGAIIHWYSHHARVCGLSLFYLVMMAGLSRQSFLYVAR